MGQEEDAADALRRALLRSQRSEQTLQGIFGASPVALAVFVVEAEGGVDDSGRRRGELIFLDVNEAWWRTTGHRREDTIGRRGAELNLWMDPDMRRRFIDQMRDQGSVKRFEARMRRADDGVYFALVSGQDVLVNDERFHIVAIDDITEQKRSAEQLRALNRQMNTLLDAAQEVGIIATDTAGRITVFNHGAECMLGYAAEEMLGQPELGLHHPDDLRAHGEALAFRPGFRNWILQRKDGKPVQVSTALSALNDEQGRGHGVMRLTAHVTDDQLRIEFIDDGQGMSAATLARNYDPFFTSALGQGGSGLGMHITHNLVTGPLGGEIEVQSRPGEGSGVVVTVPLVAPGQRTASPVSSRAG